MVKKQQSPAHFYPPVCSLPPGSMASHIKQGRKDRDILTCRFAGEIHLPPILEVPQQVLRSSPEWIGKVGVWSRFLSLGSMFERDLFSKDLGT